jgi:hypothetical protein
MFLFKSCDVGHVRQTWISYHDNRVTTCCEVSYIFGADGRVSYLTKSDICKFISSGYVVTENKRYG